MFKKALFSMVLLGMLVTPLFAQSADNVEKALRFRAKAANQEVVQGGRSARIEPQDVALTPVPLKGSRAQLEHLGGFIWNHSDSQLEDLGGFAWNSSNSQLEDLGGYIWNSSDSQLEDLGGYIWLSSGSQLKDLGGYIWSNSESQLKDLGGYIWSHSGSQLKDLGCPYCNRGNVFGAGQLKDLGPFVINSGSQLKDFGPHGRPPAFSAGQLEDLGQSRWAIAYNPAAASLKISVR
jgi:hypothetical protein